MEMSTPYHGEFRSANRIPFVVRHRTGLTWIPGLAFFAALLFSRSAVEETASNFAIEMVGFALITVASLGRIWCGIYIAGRKNKELCQDGPYSLSRNPLYVFSFIGTMGVAMGARVPWLAAVAAPVFWIYYRLVIKTEEARLHELFGEEFESYRRRVPMVWPRLSGYWSRAEFPIRPAKLLESVVDASWFLWMIIGIELLEPVRAALLTR